MRSFVVSSESHVKKFGECILPSSGIALPYSFMVMARARHRLVPNQSSWHLIHKKFWEELMACLPMV
jgi:hypothetical protein